MTNFLPEIRKALQALLLGLIVVVMGGALSLTETSVGQESNENSGQQAKAEVQAGEDESESKPEPKPLAPVLWAVVRSEISPATLAFVDRVLKEAQQNQAQAIVLELDTPGGRLDSTLQIKDRFLDSEIPIWVFINRQAFSAGAMMAIAAHEIHMVKGSVMGAATPVTGQTGEKASEKIVSAVRKAVAASAEVRGRDSQVAEAMVDESIEIEGLIEKGKLLTLTADEAMEIGFVEAVHPSRESFIAAKNIDPEKLIRLEPAFAERLVQFFTHPVVASLLLTLGIWGLIAEIKSAGWGVGGTVSLVFLALFFWSHQLAGLVGLEGLILLGAGVVLILVEIFVTPGFGVAGVLGVLAFVAGLVLSLLGDPSFVTPEDWRRVMTTLSMTGVMTIVSVWASFRYLPSSRFLGRRGIVLTTSLEADVSSYQTGESVPAQVKVGMRGLARSDLRPSGVADLDNHRVTVLTEGEYIPSGAEIEVLSVFGNRVVVKQVKSV